MKLGRNIDIVQVTCLTHCSKLLYILENTINKPPKYCI